MTNKRIYHEVDFIVSRIVKQIDMVNKALHTKATRKSDIKHIKDEAYLRVLHLVEYVVGEKK